MGPRPKSRERRQTAWLSWSTGRKGSFIDPSHDAVDDPEVVLDVRDELPVARMIGALDAHDTRLEGRRVRVKVSKKL